jgi:caa(3)-type oxidase subunit IV
MAISFAYTLSYLKELMNQSLPHPEKLSAGKYIIVFISLICLTVLTVSMSYLKRPFEAAVAGSMTIATIKGCLVSRYFMHLRREKPIIFWLLGLTFILFAAILALPVIGLIHDLRSNAPLFS